MDEIAPRSRFDDAVAERVATFAAGSDRPAAGDGIALPPIAREFTADGVAYEHVAVEIDRDLSAAFFEIRGPDSPPPQDADGIRAEGSRFWPLALARELDDAILHLRANEGEIGTWVFRAVGDAELVEAYDNLLLESADYWLSREVTLYLKRTLKRLDVSSRSLVALVEPGSCFAGTLLELALAADRCYMLDGVMDDDEEPPTVRLTGMNFGPLPMVNGLTRAEGRFLDTDELEEHLGRDLDAADAHELGLVTFIPDDIDWEGRGAPSAGGAGQLLARRSDRHGGQPALRRPGDAGEQDIRAAQRLAELDFPAPQRLGQPGRVASLRDRGAGRVRPAAGVTGLLQNPCLNQDLQDFKISRMCPNPVHPLIL